ncbi:MAG TPA: WD40 repeat domain-containing protein [Gemmataceae bacterium]|nr:WD40 repeat domain-containing protein [Gemmataceae bacterium]
MVRGRILIPAFSIALFNIALAPSVSQAIQPPAKPRVDAYGDPLPEGAVARLGTNRWRTWDSPLVYSPDGKIVLAAGRQTRVFDAVTGKLLRIFDLQSSRAIFIAGSKTAMLASPIDNKLIFVNVDTGKVTREVSINGYQCAWSADGKRVAYPNRNPGVHAWSYAVWDIEAGKQIQQWDSSWAAKAFAISPDGKRLALSDHREISVFDIGTGIELANWKSTHVTRGSAGANNILAFSPDGKIIATADEHRVMLWDPATGKFAKLGKLGPDLPITHSDPLALAFSTDGHYLAAGCDDGSLYVWDLQAGALACKLLHAGNGLPLFGVTFAPDGKTLITQALLCISARVWDIPSGREISSAEGNISRVDALAFSPDGKSLATSGVGDPPSLWDVGSGKLLRRFESLNAAEPRGGALAFDSAGKWLATLNRNNVTIWDLDDGKLVRKGVGWKRENTSEIAYVSNALDDKTLVTLFQGDVKQRGSEGELLFINPKADVRWTMIGAWDMTTGKVNNAFRVEAENVTGMQLSADRNIVMAFGTLPADNRERYVFGWDPRAKTELFRIPLPDLRDLDCIWLSPDAKTVVVYPSYAVLADRKHRFYYFEVASAKLRHVFEHEIDDLACRSELAHERLAAVIMLDSIVLFDPLAGKELRRFKSDQPSISSLAFSPNCKFLASAGDDTTTLIWDVGVTTNPVKNIKLTNKDLADQWADLLSPDGIKAYAAIHRFSQAPKQSVAFFNEQVQPPAIVVTTEKLKELVDQLDGQRYADREKASHELLGLGELARPILEALVNAPPSLEAKQRAEQILKKLQAIRGKGPLGLTGEPLREARVVEVLEIIGTADARDLLARYAKGAPHAVLTREAQASLKRMGK